MYLNTLYSLWLLLYYTLLQSIRRIFRMAYFDRRASYIYLTLMAINAIIHHNIVTKIRRAVLAIGPCQLIRRLLALCLFHRHHFQQALAKFQTSQKVTTKTGIEQEEDLLSESAALETSLNLHILELENENKQMRHELDRVTTERDRMLQENSDIGRDKSDTEAERMRLKAEVKELKFRETRMLNDYSELEEENISLQKQVSSLRSSQVEFEGAKHEIRRLAEEIDLLNSQVEELANLKKIAEKQMEEALEALQVIGTG